jgi:hypothetical protein
MAAASHPHANVMLGGVAQPQMMMGGAVPRAGPGYAHAATHAPQQQYQQHQQQGSSAYDPFA